MGLFDNTGLDPNVTPTSDVWQATLDELQRRGIEIHGSLSQGKVDDGATAVVLKATEANSKRVVAVKIYKRPDQQVLHRNGDSIPMTNFFENERRMLAGLQQCTAVPRYFYSVDTASALTGQAIQPFHVMEFIEGQRVTKFAEESLSGDKKQRTERLTDLFQQVLRTIEEIHRYGYLHRDISDGNVLVDRQGNIRLIDLAEASPLGEEHTRLISTPGQGTDGVAGPAQQKVRAIQTDDVNSACTIGYAMFTGRWKQTGETVADWQRNLTNSGAPARITKILTKGMTPRDTNQQTDPTVWNTAHEVDTAIDAYRDGVRSRRRAKRWAIRSAVAAAFVLTVTYIGVGQFQQQAYTWNLNRLNKEQIVLAEKPRKVDQRVREHVTRAQTLEAEAAQTRAEGRHGQAANLLQQALAEIQQAGRLADDLEKITPLQAPLQAMLHDNQQWNTDCEAIRARLADLQQTYLEINTQIESGDPAQAWQTMSQLQADLVHLIKDNQQSYEIGELFAQFDSSTVGMDQELAARDDYQRIVGSREQAEREYFQRGRWPEAKTAILSQQQALQAFLQQHEDQAKKASRQAANADLLNQQMAANQALQKQLKSLNDQLQERQTELEKLNDKNSDILVIAAKDRAEREAAMKQLDEVKLHLSTVGKSLEEKSATLAKTTATLKKLTEQTESDQGKLKVYSESFAKGSAAWKQQASELAETKRKLTLAQDVINRLKSTPGANTEDAEIMVRLAEAEAAIRQFNPDSWQVAQERLLAEAAVYEKLTQQRQTETALGKTEKHRDVQRIDMQLESQFRVVIEALKHRNQADRDAWTTYESQIVAQQTLREAKLTEGWAATSKAVRDIDSGISALKQQQQPYLVGKSRHEQNNYQFASWSKLAELLDLKVVRTLAVFGDVKLGSRFTNSLGQVFVYLPPGTFEMGSPTNETGRDGDEGRNSTHTVKLTDGFFMAIHETTQGPYQKITGETPWKGQASVREGPNYPATYVSWDDAKDKFVKRLNETERAAKTLPAGMEYRLPTEAQWEYAARAGTQVGYSFGDDATQLGHYAWFDENVRVSGEHNAQPVGQKLPNPWGLYDMMGNVWELTDAFNTYGTSQRGVRGGSWGVNSTYCRVTSRHWYSSDNRNCYLGFRLALVQVSSQ